MDLKTSDEYLWQLKHARIDRQTNQMHKHFSTLLESIKKETLKNFHQNDAIFCIANFSHVIYLKLNLFRSNSKTFKHIIRIFLKYL